MVERFWWLDRIVLEALRLRICIGIEHRFIDWTTTRPEAATAYFVRIGLDIHKMGFVWSAWVHRCRTWQVNSILLNNKKIQI
jgi:hypothetical protein